MTIPTDVYSILPIIVMFVWALVALLMDLWTPEENKGQVALLAATGLASGLFIELSASRFPVMGFNQMIVDDGVASFLTVLFCITGIAGIGLAHDYFKRMGNEQGEFYPLLMFSVCGMVLMAHANDLILIFLALELLSIPLYVMAGIARPQPESEEAALKYFLLGTLAAAFLLFGVALVYGATSTTHLSGVLIIINAGMGNPVLLLSGAALILVGLSFKLAAAPFHVWSPDVYQGAPSPVTGFMSVGAKAAAVAALLRVLMVAFSSLAADISPILWGLAALTMVVGNVAALVQTNIKRMLAYSSIAHGGYMLMAFVPFGIAAVANDTMASMLFYLVVYALTSFGAWAVVILLEKAEGKGLELADYAGLGKKHPWMALAMMIFMLSFTGMPLTLGFWGKFYLFRTAIQGGFTGLAVVGLLTSVASAFYYLRVIVIMYMKPGEPEVHQDLPVVKAMVGVSALAVVVLSFIPTPLLDMAMRAMLGL